MLQSLRENAPTTVVREMDVSPLVAAREQTGARTGQRPSITALLVRAVATTLRSHELLMANLVNDNEVVVGESTDIGVAVETDESMIMVPVVRQADKKSLPVLNAVLADLTERARSRRILPDELSGGVFTITNYGVFGSDFGTPIISPPQSAILGVGRFQQRPLWIDGRVQPRWVTYFSLTYDHRVIYGGPAARFLADLEIAFTKLSAWADAVDDEGDAD